MRLTKYRGKAVDDGDFIRKGDWVYGSLVNNIYFKDTKEPIPFIFTTAYCERCFNNCDDNEGFFGCDDAFVKVDPKTIGQYIEISDVEINNKEVYEGDMAKVYTQDHNGCDHEETGDVIYGLGEFVIRFEDGSFMQFSVLYINDFHCEVIGSSHDNPELL